jgi:hypothetical protein
MIKVTNKINVRNCETKVKKMLEKEEQEASCLKQ